MHRNFCNYKAKNASLAIAKMSIFNAVIVRICAIICDILGWRWYYGNFCSLLSFAALDNDLFLILKTKKMSLGKTAIILGATGLTGGKLLQQLVNDKRYAKIILFSRNSVGIKDPKIQEHLIDLFQLKNYEKGFVGDEVYCCVGTTKKKTPDEETYRKVDYGIPVNAAKLAQKNGIKTFCVISAIGANADSRLFYLKTKGEMEAAVLQQNISNTYILRPSLITGKRDESRKMEGFSAKVMRLINKLLVGPLKKYRSIPAEKIAAAMLFLGNNPSDQRVFDAEEIRNIEEKK